MYAYAYMYTCTRMSCIYSMSCKHVNMCISIQFPSRQYLARCQRRRWQCQRLEIFVRESNGNRDAWTSWSFCSFWAPLSCPETIRVDLSPPGGSHRNKKGTGITGTLPRSRNYSRELRERTSLTKTSSERNWGRSEWVKAARLEGTLRWHRTEEKKKLKWILQNKTISQKSSASAKGTHSAKQEGINDWTRHALQDTLRCSQKSTSTHLQWPAIAALWGFMMTELNTGKNLECRSRLGATKSIDSIGGFL